MTEARKGELAVLSGMLLWGIFPVIVILSYLSLAPLVSLTVSTALAALFFAILLTIKRGWGQLADFSIWAELLYISLFIGVGYYGFYFLGLKYTTAGNASLLALSETFFSYLFFNVWRKEPFSKKQILGAAFMIFGAMIVLSPNIHGFNKGDLLIIMAVLCAPLGNYFQRKARSKINSEAVMFGRSFLSLPFLVLLTLIFSETFSIKDIQVSFWFLLFNGFIFFGLVKILWLEGIHRISVTKGNSLHSIGPLITLIASYLLLKQVPTLWQLVAFVPLSVGLVLITSKNKQIDQNGA